LHAPLADGLQSLATTPNHVYYARTSTDGAVYVSSILIDATERRRASRVSRLS
jgi:hypothetical protein